MFNVNGITNENNKEHNKKFPLFQIILTEILIIGGSGSEKANALLNLIKEQNDIDKILLNEKDLSEAKYEFLSKKCEDTGTKQLNDSNAFTKCSNTMDDFYENIDYYNTIRKRKKNYCF